MEHEGKAPCFLGMFQSAADFVPEHKPTSWIGGKESMRDGDDFSSRPGGGRCTSSIASRLQHASPSIEIDMVWPVVAISGAPTCLWVRLKEDVDSSPPAAALARPGCTCATPIIGSFRRQAQMPGHGRASVDQEGCWVNGDQMGRSRVVKVMAGASMEVVACGKVADDGSRLACCRIKAAGPATRSSRPLTGGPSSFPSTPPFIQELTVFAMAQITQMATGGTGAVKGDQGMLAAGRRSVGEKMKVPLGTSEPPIAGAAISLVTAPPEVATELQRLFFKMAGVYARPTSSLGSSLQKGKRRSIEVLGADGRFAYREIPGDDITAHEWEDEAWDARPAAVCCHHSCPKIVMGGGARTGQETRAAQPCCLPGHPTPMSDARRSVLLGLSSLPPGPPILPAAGIPLDVPPWLMPPSSREACKRAWASDFQPLMRQLGHLLSCTPDAFVPSPSPAPRRRDPAGASSPTSPDDQLCQLKGDIGSNYNHLAWDEREYRLTLLEVIAFLEHHRCWETLSCLLNHSESAVGVAMTFRGRALRGPAALAPSALEGLLRGARHDEVSVQRLLPPPACAAPSVPEGTRGMAQPGESRALGSALPPVGSGGTTTSPSHNGGRGGPGTSRTVKRCLSLLPRGSVYGAGGVRIHFEDAVAERLESWAAAWLDPNLAASPGRLDLAAPGGREWGAENDLGLEEVRPAACSVIITPTPLSPQGRMLDDMMSLRDAAAVIFVCLLFALLSSWRA